MRISLIICTRDRAESLRATLAALERVVVPDGATAELLVADNGSTDHTAAVVDACALPNLSVRSLRVPARGQARARNAAMDAAAGEIIVFTDDDVRPEPDWLARLCTPLVAGAADAVVGRVTIAPHLDRDWMSVEHWGWLACTRWLEDKKPEEVELVGANMAFRREVLARVPRFDPELGPGALGFGDDSLFSWQLRGAGFRIATAFDAIVEHHFEESRLGRRALIDQARKRGQTQAYLAHHWEHRRIAHPRLFLARRALQWVSWRAGAGRQWRWPDGMAPWEMHLLREIHFYKRFLVERDRPRHYERHGVAPPAPASV